MVSGGGFLGPGRSILMVIPVVFNGFAFAFCEVFEGLPEYDAFAGK